MVRTELKVDGGDKDIKRTINRILGNSTLIEIVLYIVMASFGYWMMCGDTPQLIITRLDKEGSRDIAMLIARFLICFNLCVCIPMNGNPCRNQIFSAFGVTKPNKGQYVGLTALLLLSSALVAYFFPNVINVISFLGGFCCVFLVITFPGRNSTLFQTL